MDHLPQVGHRLVIAKAHGTANHEILGKALHAGTRQHHWHRTGVWWWPLCVHSMSVLLPACLQVSIPTILYFSTSPRSEKAVLSPRHKFELASLWPFCVLNSWLSVAITKCPREITQREKFILAHDFRGPGLPGSLSSEERGR